MWVVPARELSPLLRTYKTRVVVSRAALRAVSERYRHAWHLVMGQELPHLTPQQTRPAAGNAD